MQVPRPSDISIHLQPPSGSPAKVMSHSMGEMQAELDRIIQRKVVYYSDFELDMNEWRIEHECIQIYSQTLRKILGESWVAKLSGVLFKVLDTGKAASLEKNSWDVALEYVLLTQHSKKEVKQRVEELEAYYQFYGYHVGDPASFTTLMEQLLSRITEAAAAIEKFQAFETTYQRMQKEKAVTNLKALYKEAAHDTSRKKTHPIKYLLPNRVVSPLMLANVRVVEQYFPKSEPMECEKDSTAKVETKFEQMCIQDDDVMDPKPVPAAKGPQSNSLKAKRSFMEMQKLESANYDLFSIGVLNAIFGYMDYQSAKVPDTTQYSVVGRFVVDLYEVHATELKNIHNLIGVDMIYDNINLRVIKPYKKFYSLLLRVALKFGLGYLPTVNSSDYVNAVQSHVGTAWRPTLKVPVEFFCECCKGLVKEMKTKGVSEFFEFLRGKLLQVWEMEVVQRSGTFKKAKVEH